jgi:hypothetical protein
MEKWLAEKSPYVLESFYEYQAMVGQSIGMSSKETWKLHKKYKELALLRNTVRR